MKQPKTSLYTIISHNHHAIDQETQEVKWYKVGDTVELTDAQAKAFKDKVKPKDLYAAELKHQKRIDDAVKREKAAIAAEEAAEQAKLQGKQASIVIDEDDDGDDIDDEEVEKLAAALTEKAEKVPAASAVVKPVTAAKK